MPIPHYCHALDCKKQVRRNWLMCFDHWQMVPLEIKRIVYKSYRRAQTKVGGIPSYAWIVGANAAIKSVAVAEGKDSFIDTASPVDRLLQHTIAFVEGEPKHA